MTHMTQIGRRRLFQLAPAAALVAAGCGTSTPTPVPTPTGREPQLTIVQGTVGSLGSARVGYANRTEGADQVSIWRNDDESGFGSTVSLRDGDWAFIGGECWAMTRLESADGRARIGFDPVLTKVKAPSRDAGLIYAPAGPDDLATAARIGTGNRMAVVELTADSAVLRHWPGLSGPRDDGRLVPVKTGSTIRMGRVTVTVTAFRPSLDRLRGYVVVRVGTG